MDYRKLQSEVVAWSERNFGPITPGSMSPVLGMIEEVGELAHAVLKGKQGIRGATPESTRADALDALGDLVIFAANVCGAHGLDLGDAVYLAKGIQKLINHQPAEDVVDMTCHLSEMVTSWANLVKDGGRRPIGLHFVLGGSVLNLVDSIAMHFGTDLDDVVAATWAEVSQRDWVKYPETGRPPVDPDDRCEGCNKYSCDGECMGA